VMGRGRDFRGGGIERGYHADESDAPGAPSDRPSPRPFGAGTMPNQGAAVEAIVKWFNSEKGFGFAEIADGSGDAFLHIKTLQAFGQDTIAPGTQPSALVGQGQKAGRLIRSSRLMRAALRKCRHSPLRGLNRGEVHRICRPQ
jgi:CspA family cold shock protein